MSNEDILVRCFGVCKNSKNVKRLLDYLIDDHFGEIDYCPKIMDKLHKGTYYSDGKWGKNMEVFNALIEAIPDVVQYFGKDDMGNRIYLIFDDWERDI